MAKYKKESGIFQLKSGFWGYRFAVYVDGKQIAKRKVKDANGNRLRSRQEAIIAKEAAVAQAREDRKRKVIIKRRTMKEVYEEYRAIGSSDRAYETLRKQNGK